jgi:peptidoglycan lytic transglycosylase G
VLQDLMKHYPLNKKNSQRLLVAVLLLLIPLSVFGLFLATSPGNGRNVQLVDFGRGSTLGNMAAELAARKIISSARLFTLYARLSGADSRLKAGTYQFDDGMKPAEIINKMVAGDVYLRLFALPEGYSIYQAAELLHSRGLFNRESFLRECANRQLLAEIGVPGKSAEGYLYPGSYNILPNMTETELIRQMVKKFNEVYAARFAARAQKAGMSSTEVLTLASMIEKEAVEPSERPLIAAVFYNRLRKGMRLQSDPTAVYGVRAFAGKVSKRDIMRPSPYNTYLISGLPPGPVGNPGSAAIEAVLNPARSPHLYFVAKKDGSHYFSSSLEEHNQAVNRYLKSSAASASAAGRAAGYTNDHPNLTGRR